MGKLEDTWNWLTGAYSSGQFLFVLDGCVDQAFVRSVSGGFAKGSVISETMGPDHLQFKHLGTVEIDPINLEIGMAVSKPILEWIRASWERKYFRKNGSVIHADAQYKAKFEQEFHDALITETIFPTLDAEDENPAYLKVNFLPEQLTIKPMKENRIQAVDSDNQKSWSAANFEFRIDGLDTRAVSRIESFSVKQHVKQLYVGAERFPEIEPAGLEFSNITCYISASNAGDFIKWHQEYVVNGAKDTAMEKQGAIEFKDPSGKTLFTVDLHNVGIHSLSVEASEGNAAKVKRFKVELYVESMKLDYTDRIS